jgi:hypothetical protein
MSSLPPRGICNPSGTACHLSSAIILLYHCLEPLRDCILTLARTNATDDDVVHRLACLFRELEDDDEAAVDRDTVTLLYDAVRKSIGVEAHELGDAVTALVKLMQHICGFPSFQSVWNDWVDSGRVHSVLTGKRSVAEGDDSVEKNVGNEQLLLHKETKIRHMAVPFPVPNESTLLDAIRATLSPKVIEGYQWKTMTTSRDDCEWSTTKTLHLDSLPPIWLVHLDRYVWNGGRVVGGDGSMEIPIRFYTQEFWNPKGNSSFPHINKDGEGCCYNLMGGILHVEDDNDNDDQEGGHYVTLVRGPQEEGEGEGGETQWYLVDDDQVVQVDQENALQMLGGGPARHQAGAAPYMRGLLLVYQQLHPFPKVEEKTVAIEETEIASTKDGEKEDKDDGIDWSRPRTLVGRRLRVKWAKGKYYGGMVDVYHAATGKHQVRYDDGEVQSYTLRKKTIVWEA